MAAWLIALIVILGLAAFIIGLRAYYVFVSGWRSRRQLRAAYTISEAPVEREAPARAVPPPLRTVYARSVAPMEREAPARAVPPPLRTVYARSVAPMERETSVRAVPPPLRTVYARSGAPMERETPVRAVPPPLRTVYTRSVAPMEREALTAAMPTAEVAKEVVIPRGKEVYKEAGMDGNYVARDDSEAKIIRLVHPDCNLIIPPDYEEAINIVIRCPLTCPYRALLLAELDQEALRKHTMRSP